MGITRRQLLQVLAWTSATSALPASQALRAQSGAGLQDVFTFEEFLWISRLLTKEETLDEGVGRKIFKLILDEPYGREHLFDVHGILNERLRRHSGPAPVSVRPDYFSQGQQWFIGHLMITWYTGVYFHERGNRAVTLGQALMYRKLEDLRSAPTFCAGAPGSWSSPPAGKA